VIVPDWDYDAGGVIGPAGDPMLYSGGISSDWMDPPETPRRRIGFRMPEPEWVPDDPSWVLL